ncbi:hypothetical protein F3Y30_15610 [Sinorhizobium sp. BG8]|nr:hypothetical protein F3Y30_15610 [Sinorhizobium sp. BG8]
MPSGNARPTKERMAIPQIRFGIQSLRYALPDPERAAVVPRRQKQIDGHRYRTVIETLSNDERRKIRKSPQKAPCTISAALAMMAKYSCRTMRLGYSGHLFCLPGRHLPTLRAPTDRMSGDGVVDFAPGVNAGSSEVDFSAGTLTLALRYE